uniref:Uncharacterized protein n=1 Tax=Mycena chlorophos TaxID=658473 RepID=A0ABQ0LLA1_MYCCL|nr:predicted protein [Mycena chlorophos]
MRRQQLSQPRSGDEPGSATAPPSSHIPLETIAAKLRLARGRAGVFQLSPRAQARTEIETARAFSSMHPRQYPARVRHGAVARPFPFSDDRRPTKTFEILASPSLAHPRSRNKPLRARNSPECVAWRRARMACHLPPPTPISDVNDGLTLTCCPDSGCVPHAQRPPLYQQQKRARTVPVPHLLALFIQIGAYRAHIILIPTSSSFSMSIRLKTRTRSRMRTSTRTGGLPMLPDAVPYYAEPADVDKLECVPNAELGCPPLSIPTHRTAPRTVSSSVQTLGAVTRTRLEGH